MADIKQWAKDYIPGVARADAAKDNVFDPVKNWTISTGQDIAQKIADPTYDLIPFGPGANANSNPVVRDPSIDPGLVKGVQTRAANDAATQQQEQQYQEAQDAAEANRIAAEQAYYAEQDAMLMQALERLQRNKDQGYQNIEDSYQGALGGANKQRERALENFGMQREDTQKSQGQATDRIMTNQRTLADSVRRMLGMASGTGSSAYQITAPGAINRQANLQHSDVQDTFSKNFRDLSVSERRAEDDYTSLLDELSNRRNTAKRDYEQGYMEQQNTIAGQRADIARQQAALRDGGYGAIQSASQPFQADINNRNSQIDSLFEKYRNPIKARDLRVDTPTLRDYRTERVGLNGSASQQQTAGNSTTPYAQVLGNREDEEEEALL